MHIVNTIHLRFFRRFSWYHTDPDRQAHGFAKIKKRFADFDDAFGVAVVQAAAHWTVPGELGVFLQGGTAFIEDFLFDAKLLILNSFFTLLLIVSALCALYTFPSISFVRTFIVRISESHIRPALHFVELINYLTALTFDVAANVEINQFPPELDFRRRNELIIGICA